MRKTPTERFWEKVNRTDACWLWTGAGSGGYGRFWYEGRVQPAHRVSYEWQVGPIPDGLYIDHLCRTPACVNPEHLEPVTQKANVDRGIANDWQRAKTECPQGHAYNADNTKWYEGRRYCRACARAYSLNYVRRKREERMAG
jgi:hypothetical protein